MPNTANVNRPSHALRALILTLSYPHRASYYDDWRNAFERSPFFECSVENILGIQTKDLERRIRDFDVIILLHSCGSDTLEYLNPLAPVLARRSRAKLFAFVGNEFNSPYVSMAQRISFLKETGADFVATQLLLDAGKFLYERSQCRVVSVPHALNPDAFSPGKGHAVREIDLGYRGYRYPPYLGDNDRNRMIDSVSAIARSRGLKTDISEDARLDRQQWAAFLGNSRGTISTETGSWFLSPDDALMQEIHRYLRSKDRRPVLKNDGVLRSLARRLPTAVKSVLWTLLKKGPVGFEMFEDFNVSFSELNQKFFKHHPRAQVYSKAISSRHFDAVGTKTCQIMLEGRYNDILQPGRHYISVKSDLSNLDDAIEQFMDLRASEEIAAAAYDLVMSEHTYQHRAKQVFTMLGALR